MRAEVIEVKSGKYRESGQRRFMIRVDGCFTPYDTVLLEGKQLPESCRKLDAQVIVHFTPAEEP